MWDANSTPQDLDVQTFLEAYHLHNLQSWCTSTIPINTSARGRHIDFLFGTTLLQISLRKSGILNCNNSPQSDHRALFADFDKQALFQGSTTDPTAPSQWLLRLNNLSQCKTYLKLVHAYFTAHKITERSTLKTVSKQTHQPASCLPFMTPLIETSPKAYSMQNKSQHDHHTDHHGHQHLQKRTGTHLLETPLLRLPTKKGCISKHFRPNHTGVQFQLQPSLSKQTHTFFSLHCLQAARFSLYECHLNASHLRQEHL